MPAIKLLGRDLRRQRFRGQAFFRPQFVDHLGDDERLPMGFENRIRHVRFGQFAGETFDHADAVFMPGDDQIEFARFHLLEGRHHDQLAIHSAHPHRTNDFEERNLSDVKRGTGPDECQHVRVERLVGGHHRRHDLNFVQIVHGKERPNRAIHQPAGERFFRTRPGFPFDKAAGEFPGRVSSFAVIAGEREEVPPGNWIPGHRRDEHGRIAEANDDGSVGLFGEFSGFKRQSRLAERPFDAND